MKIDITYEIPTAYGLTSVKGAVAYTLEEADELCNAIEAIGYKILDVTRDVYSE